MKESIAQTFIVSLILFFFGILLLLLFGSINYSKAYKAKNRIITIIEKYGSYNEEAIEEINQNLADGGYQLEFSGNINDDCERLLDGDNARIVTDQGTGGRGYHYCVIEYENGLGKYYKVGTFMQFNIPIIGGFLKFPVRGETKILYDNVVNIDEN